jgi:hypothetical protein
MGTRTKKAGRKPVPSKAKKAIPSVTKQEGGGACQSPTTPEIAEPVTTPLPKVTEHVTAPRPTITVAEPVTASPPEISLADFAKAALEQPDKVLEFRPFGQAPRTAKEWCEAKIAEPVEFLGNRIWHSLTKGMFVMKTDKGKTQWAVALGLHMAWGKSFCDWSPKRKARVLYIEGESPSYLMQETVRLQCKALGEHEPRQNFRLISASTEKIPFLNIDPRRKNPYDGLKWIDERLAEWRPDFIFFDNLSALCPVMVSTSARGWIEQMMTLVITPLNLLGIGQLWLHHPDKSGKQQHGTGARNWVCIWTCLVNLLLIVALGSTFASPARKRATEAAKIPTTMNGMSGLRMTSGSQTSAVLLPWSTAWTLILATPN